MKDLPLPHMLLKDRPIGCELEALKKGYINGLSIAFVVIAVVVTILCNWLYKLTAEPKMLAHAMLLGFCIILVIAIALYFGRQTSGTAFDIVGRIEKSDELRKERTQALQNRDVIEIQTRKDRETVYPATFFPAAPLLRECLGNLSHTDQLWMNCVHDDVLVVTAGGRSFKFLYRDVRLYHGHCDGIRFTQANRNTTVPGSMQWTPGPVANLYSEYFTAEDPTTNLVYIDTSEPAHETPNMANAALAT